MKLSFPLKTLFYLASGVFVIILLVNTLKSDQELSYDQFLMQEFQRSQANLQVEMSDQPDMAAFQNYSMTVDPELKRVPNERLFNANKYPESVKQNSAYKNSNDEIEWTETGSNMGGRTRAVMWDPNDSNGTKVWAGGVTGGLWYIDDIYDNSSNWIAVNDFWPSLSVSCIDYDLNDPMTFYIGTGEYQTAREIYRESSGVGIGIWKSTDGGLSWNIIPSTESFKYISDIKVRDEAGTSVIYAGVVSGTYHGINHQSEPNDGLYRSSDGGETWEQVLPDIAGSNVPYAPADLDIGPNGRIFVGTMKNLNGDGGSTILYSDNGTIGSWTVYDDYVSIIQSDPDYYIPGRVIMAAAPSDENRVYALVGAGYLNSVGFNYERGRYILKSDDGGQNWTETNLPGGDPDWATLSWHAFIGAVSPSNPDELYVGGLDVWKSSNQGSSWSHVSDWALMYYGGGDDYVHADQHVQIYKDGSSDEMLFGSDGGVFYTANGSSSNPVFEEKNNNFSTLQFYTIDIYPVPGQNHLIGGLQDNGTLLFMGDPLDINDMVDGGDGAYCFFDETQPNIMITSTYYNSYTLFYNWNYYDDMGDYGTGIFINPADYDSENNILYANGCTFGGSYSNRILRIAGIPDNPYDQMVNVYTGLNVYFTHIKVSPHAPQGTSTLFAGSLNGKLFKITNAQSSPTSVEISSSEFPNAYLSSVSVGGSEDTLLATFSNYGVQSVWQTYDGGENWNDISGNLPDMPIRWSLYHPQNAKQVMLATEVGIWTTTDGSVGEVTWEPDPGMPNVRVDMIQMRTIDNTVAAATHGRGMMYGIWEYNPTISVIESKTNDLSVFPNPSSGFVTLELKNSNQSKVYIYNQEGKQLIEQEVQHSARIDLSDLPEGMYFVKTLNGNECIVEKIILR